MIFSRSSQGVQAYYDWLRYKRIRKAILDAAWDRTSGHKLQMRDLLCRASTKGITDAFHRDILGHWYHPDASNYQSAWN